MGSVGRGVPVMVVAGVRSGIAGLRRFLNPEWERIEAFAENRGLTGPEYVRFATLAAMEDEAGATERLAELIRMSFRATYILATNMRNEMLGAGREEVDESSQPPARCRPRCWAALRNDGSRV